MTAGMRPCRARAFDQPGNEATKPRGTPERVANETSSDGGNESLSRGELQQVGI